MSLSDYVSAPPPRSPLAAATEQLAEQLTPENVSRTMEPFYETLRMLGFRPHCRTQVPSEWDGLDGAYLRITHVARRTELSLWTGGKPGAPERRGVFQARPDKHGFYDWTGPRYHFEMWLRGIARAWLGAA